MMSKIGPRAKRAAAVIISAVMLFMSAAGAAPETAYAAVKPALSKTSFDLLTGKSYKLSVSNKVSKAVYTWSSSNDKVAAVSQAGVVTGVKKGTATINCRIETSGKNYQLACKVSVRKPAESIKVSSKVTALNAGQEYKLETALAPASSNDAVSFKSSNKAIASPDKNGKLKALKEGKVTITATTLSGARDSFTFTVVKKDGAVSTQKELKALLGSGVQLITIKTGKAASFTIPEGNYGKQKLVVDAPKAEVHNKGNFASVTIKQIKSNTWYEGARGNQITVTAESARLVLDTGALAEVTVSRESIINLEINGEIKQLNVNEKADIHITGSNAEKPVPVTVNAAGASVETVLPLNLNCHEKLNLTLLKGAEDTRINAENESAVPVIYGDYILKVIVGSGKNSREITVTPLPAAVISPVLTPLPTVTQIPTQTPTWNPEPSSEPAITATPTATLTETPTEAPATPTEAPTEAPATPTETPTEEPTATPTKTPTEEPTATLTEEPTSTLTEAPTSTPTLTPTVSPSAEPGEEEYNDLNQSQIVSAMGAGWNLGNQLEAVLDGIPGETSWGNPVITEELIKAVKAAGFQTIRIPVSYFDYIGSGPEYRIEESWLDRVQEVVDYCVKNDMYAVINVHGDGYYTIDGSWLLCGEEDQDAIRAKYKALWGQIGARFKDYDEHLIFESMNEVFDNTYGEPVAAHYANINAYNQIFVDTVRQSGGYNDRRWVLIPGWNTDIHYTAEDYGFVIPTDHYLSERVPEGEHRIMISVHDYTPWDFCGGTSDEITQWGEAATNPLKVSKSASESSMALEFKLLSNAFTSKGYPVVIGEYGSVDKSGFDAENTLYRAYFAQKICENSVKYGCVPVIWDNGYNGDYGFGLFDRETKTVTGQPVIDGIMKVYHPADEPGNSAGITLDKTELHMVFGGDSVKLNALLTPADSTDRIRWSSSDESVATVSSDGVVRAQTKGTAIITASANGNTAQCTVTVAESDNVIVALYAVETANWSTIKSLTNAEITGEGGTYTLKMVGTRNALSNIGSLFIKDIMVQGGLSKNSLYSAAKIQVNSVKFNGMDCTVTQTGPQEAIGGKALDFVILNQWAAGSEKIAEADKNSSGSYYFTAAGYQDSNTIEVTFTVTDVTKASVTPTPTPIPDTKEAVATPVDSIRYDFTITGVGEEKELTFQYTAASWFSGSKTLELNGDGEYSLTIDMDSEAGMVNMGYFDTISGSSIKAKLDRIMVNGIYELNYPAELDVSSTYLNGLNNIWNVSIPGTKIAEGEKGYIALKSDAGAFGFYVYKEESTPAPAATPITSIRYDFNITDLTEETELEFINTAVSWSNGTAYIAVKGDGNYSFTISVNNENGMKNLGYFTTIAESTAKAVLSSITINDTYELSYAAQLEIGSDNKNGLGNIWNISGPGTKAAEGPNGYLALNEDSSAIVFYAN